MSDTAENREFLVKSVLKRVPRANENELMAMPMHALVKFRDFLFLTNG